MVAVKLRCAGAKTKMSRHDSKADFKVHDITTLGKSRDAEAKDMLRKVAHQVGTSEAPRRGDHRGSGLTRPPCEDSGLPMTCNI